MTGSGKGLGIAAIIIAIVAALFSIGAFWKAGDAIDQRASLYKWDRDKMRPWAVHVHYCHLPIYAASSSTPADMQGHSTSATCAEQPTHIPPPPPPPPK